MNSRKGGRVRRTGELHLLPLLSPPLPLFLLFLMISPLFSPPLLLSSAPLRAESRGGGALFTSLSIASSYVTTRRQAVIDFLAALQLKDGGFVPTLTWRGDDTDVEVGAPVLECLEVLGGLEAVDLEAAMNFAAQCQAENGGFSYNPEDPSPHMRSIDSALRMLRVGDAFHRIDKEAAIEWLLSLQRPDGGFDPYHNALPSSCLIDDTVDAIVSLQILGALDRLDREKTVQALLRHYVEDAGAFAWIMDGGTPDECSTMSGVEALYLLGALDRIDTDKVASYITSNYDPNTGSYDSHLTWTWYVVKTLYYLDRLSLLNATATIEFVLSLQSHKHGGFLTLPNYEGDEEDGIMCWFAVFILEVLGGLDRLEEEFVVEEEPVWHGWYPDDDGEGTPWWLEEWLRNATVVVVYVLFFGSIIIIWVLLVQRKRREERRKRRRLAAAKRRRVRRR